MTRSRCAIYTRKSSEDGLEQSFNSLDAQREACEAYISSQKSEGWNALHAQFDDGGYSGGNMQRPAFQRLLKDIAAGRVDVVVVYKVDRLTRSLADFAKIVEVFDQHGVSFVSVTQSFNTTTSMGRLTLNVLLSFEREVTGERIRDKIAASKAKGMWMGGYPPLGYEVKDRKLEIVPQEAETVKHIFARYLHLKSVNALADELEKCGVRSKVHRHSNGHIRGGTPFSRGALFHLLRNRIYIGEIVHKKLSYRGQHAAIVELGGFERVQRQIAQNGVRRTGRRSEPAPLIGRVFDAAGARMTPVHAYGKRGAKYRYYVSMGGHTTNEKGADYVSRVSAVVLEELVLDRMRAVFGRPAIAWSEVRQVLTRVDVHSTSVTLELTCARDVEMADADPDTNVELAVDQHIRIQVPACMQPRRGTTRVTAPAARLSRAHFDSPMIVALKRAHRELSARGIGIFDVAPDIALARGLDDPYVRRIAPLALLAPDIQRAILTGRQPAGLTLKRLITTQFTPDWNVQRARLGFGESR